MVEPHSGGLEQVFANVVIAGIALANIIDRVTHDTGEVGQVGGLRLVDLC